MDETLVRVRQVLETTPARWTALVASIDVELLRRPPAGGEWSALECLQHLVDTEAGAFQPRIQGFLDGRDLPAFDPDAAGMKPDVLAPPDALASAFSELRSKGLAAIDGLTNDDLDRTARHLELGPVTLREMLNEWAGHDLMHTVQGERALMQPFIAGCGPWRSYFAAHEAAER